MSEATAASALEAAVTASCTALRQVDDRDWTGPTHDLTWSVRTTVEHIASCLVGYAGQVVGQPTKGWVVPDIALETDMTPSDAVAFVAASGAILSSVVRTTASTARGFHPYGTSDPAGFACMGVVESLIHTDDVMGTFGVPWALPAAPAAVALSRLFRDAPEGDPVDVLLWCCGRRTLGDLPRRTAWRWDGTPLV
ncbi:MAG: maleylpyruvate isomerase N-terminal domain-containing protein [Actinomycetes bacterium]